MARVHRTFWVVRQRYRRAGYLGSLAAVCLVAIYLMPVVHGAPFEGAPPPPDWLSNAGLLLAAALVPSLLARLGWRIHRQRFIDDMRLVGLH
ncbi:MAG: hypothetical protein ACJ8H8_15855 [Geminicoccaceae bacterium]